MRGGLTPPSLADRYDFLLEMLVDDIIEDDGSSDSVMDDAEHLHRESASVGAGQCNSLTIWGKFRGCVDLNSCNIFSVSFVFCTLFPVSKPIHMTVRSSFVVRM